MTDRLYSESDIPLEVSLNQATCSVCCVGEGPSHLKSELRNPLHFCRACLLPVHKQCYGLKPQEDKMYFCQKCVDLGPAASPACTVCNRTGGALKRAGEFWVHVTCGLFSEPFQIQDYASMQFLPSDKPQALHTCEICQQTAAGTLQCAQCDKRAHVLCALESEEWGLSDLLFEKKVYCSTHKEANQHYCICRHGAEDQRFMVGCDACDGWYHGDCIGVSLQLAQTIDQYVCKLCDAWAHTKNKLLAEDVTEKIQRLVLKPPFVNLRLPDWLLLARVFHKRAQNLIRMPCKIEDMSDLLHVVQNLPLECPWTSDLEAKLEASKKHIEIFADILKREEPRAEDAERIHQLIDKARIIGIQIPQLDKLENFLEQAESLQKLRKFLDESRQHSLTEARVFRDTISKKISGDVAEMKEFTKMLEACASWLESVKTAVIHSSKQDLAGKLTTEQLQQKLDQEKQLPFSMPDELKKFESEIKEADRWNKDNEHTIFPLTLTELQLKLDETAPIIIKTPLMEKFKGILESHNTWVTRAQEIMNTSENIEQRPYLDEVRAHIAYGEKEIEPYVSIGDIKTQLMIKLNEASIWQANAQSALTSRNSPQRITHLLRDAKSLICNFPEILELERRSQINKKISETLHKKHREDELESLLEEGEILNADEDFLRAVTNRLESIRELKVKISEILRNPPAEDQVGVFNKLLEELKNTKTELPEQKQQLEDALKSIKWFEKTKECLEELEQTRDETDKRRKPGELEILRNLVSKCAKFVYKAPAANETLEQLSLRLWELEWQRFKQCDEYSVEQIQELEERARHISRNIPPSLEEFKSLSQQVNTSLHFFDSLLNREIDQVLNCDLLALQSEIDGHKNRLEELNVFFPDKYTKILSWHDWINWCLSTESVLSSPAKPTSNQLYDINEKAIELSIPNNVPTLQKLTKVIYNYEQWLYRFTSYYSVRKFYSTLSIDIQHYLKKSQEKPKPTLEALSTLLEEGRGLSCDTEQESITIQEDINKSHVWRTKYDQFFLDHPYKDMLANCKKNYNEFVASELYKEFNELIKQYCFDVYVSLDNLAQQLCTYEWNIRGIKFLNNKGKIQIEEWDDLFASIEHLNADHLDQFTIDRLKRQQALRLQIVDEISKLKNAETSGSQKIGSLAELTDLTEQINACKIQLPEADYIQTLKERAERATVTLQELLRDRAFVEDFKKLSAEVDSLPVSLPEVQSELKKVIEATSNLAMRIQILKQASSQKMDRIKVENLLAIYRDLPARLQQGEMLLNHLESAKQLLAEAFQAVKRDDITLTELNSLISRLDNLQIHMGHEENVLRVEMWKMRVAHSSKQKVQYPVLVGWYHEGLSMKEFNLEEQLSYLDKLVRQGDKIKAKLANTSSLQELEEVVAEANELPFDMTQYIIEQRTRISFMQDSKTKPKPKIEVKKEPESSSEPSFISSKRVIQPNIKEEYHYSSLASDSTYSNDLVRKNIVGALSNLLLKNFRFKKLNNSDRKAWGVAQRIEEYIFFNSQGKKYKDAIATVQRVLSKLLDIGNFAEKITEGEIAIEDVCKMRTSGCYDPNQIRALFKQEPPIYIVIEKSRISEHEDQDMPKAFKRPRSELPHDKLAKKPKQAAASIKSIIDTVKKEPEIKKKEVPKQVSKPQQSRSSFSLTNLLDEVKEFQKKRVEVAPKKEEPQEPVLVSEKYRQQAEQNLNIASKVDPNEEWRELSQFRLEHSGFTKVEPLFESGKRVPEINYEDQPRKKSRMEYEEGRFSSDEEDNYIEPKPADPNLAKPLYDEETQPSGKEEYNILELTQRKESSKRRSKKRSKLYDPFAANTPKNKAPQGSLLKIWSGKVVYNKQEINVDMFSIDNIQLFQKIPQLSPKLTINGRTKQSELEVYISQNATSSHNRSLLTAWLQAAPGHEQELRDLIYDLKDKERAAVVRVDSSLTIYLSNLSTSFSNFLSSLRINVNQRLDPKVEPKVGYGDKLGCIMFFKRSAASSSSILLDPEVLVEVEASSAPTNEDRIGSMSPITSDEETEDTKESNTEAISTAFQEALNKIMGNTGNYTEILSSLKGAVQTLSSEQLQQLGPNNSEINELVSMIREQVERETERSTPAVQNVNQFLSQPNPPRPSYPMYMPPTYMYPSGMNSYYQPYYRPNDPHNQGR